MKLKSIAVSPPAHLKGSRAWFTEVVSEFELEPHHVKLLIGCCEALDRCELARVQVEHDGAFQKNRFGELKAHPAIAVQRDYQIIFSRLLRELDLDVTPPAEAKRPPALRSIRGGTNAD